MFTTPQYTVHSRDLVPLSSPGGVKQQQEMVVHQNLIADENIVVRYQVSLIATYFPQYILSSFYFQFYTKSFTNSMARQLQHFVSMAGIIFNFLDFQAFVSIFFSILNVIMKCRKTKTHNETKIVPSEVICKICVQLTIWDTFRLHSDEK